LERTFAVGSRHLLQRVTGRDTGAVLVVQEFDVAAQRDPGQAPARVVAVVEPENLLAEPDRERLDAHAAPARHQEMPQLVHEYDNRQHEQESQRLQDEGGQNVHSA
jgi:hypothetical protein